MAARKTAAVVGTVAAVFALAATLAFRDTEGNQAVVSQEKPELGPRRSLDAARAELVAAGRYVDRRGAADNVGGIANDSREASRTWGQQQK